MKKLAPVLLIVLLACMNSCSKDDSLDTLNGTWTVETTGFTAEFKISNDELTESHITIKNPPAGGLIITEFHQTGGVVVFDNNRYIKVIQLGSGLQHVRILGLELNTSNTTMRGNAWFHTLYSEQYEQGIEEFLVEREL